MSEDLKELTTFLTRFNAFKYLVMPFDLCNGPVFWQHFIDNTLFNFLYYFVQVYLDDILIYTKIFRAHHLEICRVLERLCQAEIQADKNKCKFYV